MESSENLDRRDWKSKQGACDDVYKKKRPNKAEGPSEIHARLFRDCEREITLPLAMIFFQIACQKSSPVRLESANVVPIYNQ